LADLGKREKPFQGKFFPSSPNPTPLFPKTFAGITFIETIKVIPTCLLQVMYNVVARQLMQFYHTATQQSRGGTPRSKEAAA